MYAICKTLSSRPYNAHANETVPSPPSLVAGDYKYEVLVKACTGVSLSSVEVNFCSYSMCDGTMGEIRTFTLALNDDDDDGWTRAEYTLPYNPLALRLNNPDENWCVHYLWWHCDGNTFMFIYLS